MNTILANLIQGFRRVKIVLPNGNKFYINDALCFLDLKDLFLFLKILVEIDIILRL